MFSTPQPEFPRRGPKSQEYVHISDDDDTEELSLQSDEAQDSKTDSVQSSGAEESEEDEDQEETDDEEFLLDDGTLDIDFDLSSDHLSRLFHYLTKNEKLELTYEEVLDGLEIVRRSLPGPTGVWKRDEVLQIIRTCDVDKNEQISEQEFISIVQTFAMSHLMSEPQGAVEKFFCFDYDRDRAQCRFIDANAWDSNSAAPGTVSLREFLEEDHTKPRFSESTVRWIHLSGRNPGTIITLGNKYGLHPLMLEDILSHDERPRLDSSKISSKPKKKETQTSTSTNPRRRSPLSDQSPRPAPSTSPSGEASSPLAVDSTSVSPSSISPSTVTPTTSSPSSTSPSSTTITPPSTSRTPAPGPNPALSTAALAAAVAFLESRSASKNQLFRKVDGKSKTKFEEDSDDEDEETPTKKLRWGGVQSSNPRWKSGTRAGSEGNLRSRLTTSAGLGSRSSAESNEVAKKDNPLSLSFEGSGPAGVAKVLRLADKGDRSKESEEYDDLTLSKRSDPDQVVDLEKQQLTSSDPTLLSSQSIPQTTAPILSTTTVTPRSSSINSSSVEILPVPEPETTTSPLGSSFGTFNLRLPELEITPSTPSTPHVLKHRRQFTPDPSLLSPRSFSTSLSDYSKLHSPVKGGPPPARTSSSITTSTPTTTNRATRQTSVVDDSIGVTHLIIPVLTARNQEPTPVPLPYFPPSSQPPLPASYPPIPGSPFVSPIGSPLNSNLSHMESFGITSPSTPSNHSSYSSISQTSQKSMIPASAPSSFLHSSLFSSLSTSLSLPRPTRAAAPPSPTTTTPPNQVSFTSIPLAFYSSAQQYSSQKDARNYSQPASSKKGSSFWSRKSSSSKHSQSDLADTAAQLSRRSLRSQGKRSFIRPTGGLSTLLMKRTTKLLEETADVDFKLQLFSQQLNIILIDDRIVLTFQKKDSPLVVPLMSRIAYSGSKLRMNNARFLVYSLIDKVVDGLFPIMGEYQRELRRLQEEVHSDEATELTTALQVQHINREMNYAILWLKPMEGLVAEMPEYFQSSGPDFERHLHDLRDHVLTLMDQAQTMLTWSQLLNAEYLNEQQSRMNEVMYVLALVTAVFIPGQFLATVFGMNFPYMPPLNYHWGTLSFWILFFLCSTAVVVSFIKRGWLAW